MKQFRNLIAFAAFFAISIAPVFVNAQSRPSDRPRVSPNAAVSQTIGTHDLYVTFGRPSLNGRNPFGGIVKDGDIWRTGANEATAIVFPVDVLIEGKEVPAGAYSIYSIPGKTEWTIIINKKLSWGTQYDPAEDLHRIPVKPQTAPNREQMIIYFDEVTNESANLWIHWATTKVPMGIKIKG